MNGQTPLWTKLIAYAVAAVIGFVTAMVDPFNVFDDDAKGVTGTQDAHAAATRARFATEVALGAIVPFGTVAHVAPAGRVLSSIAKEYRGRQKSASL